MGWRLKRFKDDADTYSFVLVLRRRPRPRELFGSPCTPVTLPTFENEDDDEYEDERVHFTGPAES
jgi:hypothetical protein